MFRLMALLCAGIYFAMLIGGQDRGQLRFGLMQAAYQKAAEQPVLSGPDEAQPIGISAAVSEVSFAPQKPLIAEPVLDEEVAEPVSLVVEEGAPAGRLFFVAAESVNVREGPGKDHAVVDRLPLGEAVLVLVEGEGPDGWSFIRIEGDGIEGYVASRLLTE